MRVFAATLLVLATSGCGPAADPIGGDGVDSETSAIRPLPPGCAAARAPASGRYEFQDDLCQAKRWPSDLDRDFACPNRAATIPAGYASFLPLDQVVVDTDALADVPRWLDVTAIRILRDADGAPRYRYFSNGTHAHVFQPYSSTKFMAIANAAAWLRDQSDGRVGLDGRVGDAPLGDLVSVVHNYNAQHYASNALAGWFQLVGGPLRADALIHGWLGCGPAETFGGRYGAAPPSLGDEVVGDDGTVVAIAPHDLATVPNALSTLTMAEFLRRLVLHREDPAGRLPGFTWADARVLFYGAEAARWYPLPSETGVVFPRGGGGMSADAAIYLQRAVDLDDVERQSGGRWRIFGKLGYGGGGFVENAYACLPGVELVLSTHVAMPDGRSAAETDGLIAAYDQLILAHLAAR